MAYDLLMRQIEALLFVSTEPVGEEALVSALARAPRAVRDAISRLEAEYAQGRGVTLLRVAGGVMMATAPDLASAVETYRGALESSRVRLSRAAFETLAIIAYNQPVTRGEMEEIRGVRCDRVVDTLIRHGLVRAAGRKKSAGSPMLYRTTDRFLDLFGLEAISNLPTLDELRDAPDAAASDEGAFDEE